MLRSAVDKPHTSLLPVAMRKRAKSSKAKKGSRQTVNDATSKIEYITSKIVVVKLFLKGMQRKYLAAAFTSKTQLHCPKHAIPLHYSFAKTHALF